MKTRAAVALAAGKPLEVMTVDLDGPRIDKLLLQRHATLDPGNDDTNG